MKKQINFISYLILIFIVFMNCQKTRQPKYVFSIKGEKTYLNGQSILLKGVRLSNALISDNAVEEVIAHLDTFAYYGLNSFSVYFQGSRFGDIKGYREDATLDLVYSTRMARLIEAADKKGFVVLVGCLYWGTSKSRWENWTQKEANQAIFNTVSWLKTNNYRNVFIDVDNEGMALKTKNFDNRELVLAGKKAAPRCVIATNYKGDPPPEADFAIHHSNRASGKPYSQTEGSAPLVPGGYWGAYSKQGLEWKNGPDFYQYINIGVYTEEMKKAQIEETFSYLDRGEGYMMASTWLQCVPPAGPNHRPGGYGGKNDSGIRWWLEAIRAKYGAYSPPAHNLSK
ncbi:hypothetical protein JW964_29275 [candidate division KSB1 bacterium]|nr:hypothetical protein [candidate division KSB1 bacterium]